MGGFANSACKRHPHEHLRQLPGVCPSCLCEKLSKLNNIISAANAKYSTVISDSNSSFLSLSSFSSSSNSPSHRRYRRNQSDIAFISSNTAITTKVRKNLVLNGAEAEGLKKSRSVACAPVTYREAESRKGVTAGILKKGGASGLWRKLIRSASKKSKGVRTHTKE